MNKTPWAEKAAIPEVPSPSAPGKAASAQDEKQPEPPPAVFPIGQLELPPAHDDPNELLRFRYLCRGGGGLLVASTGIGKSTLSLQGALCWSIGRDLFGIVPARPLRSLIIQAENDYGDLAEMREGIMTGLGFTDRERALAGASVLVANEDARSGEEFCAEVIAPLLAEHQPDILWIDPALSYLGGEANLQRDVGKFLRNGINPLVHKHGCGVIVIHHTNKPPSGSEKPDWQAGDYAYLGSGSAEWANWPRFVLALRSIGSHEVFELRAGKRGSRLGWRGDDGERIYSKLIAHAKQDGFCWRLADEAELVTKQGRPPRHSTKDLLALLAPTPVGLKSAEWQKLAREDRGISRSTFFDLLKELTDSGAIEKDDAGRWQKSVKSDKSEKRFADA